MSTSLERSLKASEIFLSFIFKFSCILRSIPPIPVLYGLLEAMTDRSKVVAQADDQKDPFQKLMNAIIGS